MFNVDGNDEVELPVVDTAAEVDPAYEVTLAQVVKMIVTHELGHSLGAHHDSVLGGTMYEYMTDFRHDEAFSNESKSQMNIHNN